MIKTMKTIILAILTLGYTSHEEISRLLFDGKLAMLNELKQFI